MFEQYGWVVVDEIFLLLLSLIWVRPLFSRLLNYTVCLSCGRIIVNTPFPFWAHPGLSLATICRAFGNGEVEKFEMCMHHLWGKKTDTENPWKEENEKCWRPIVGSCPEPIDNMGRSCLWSGKCVKLTSDPIYIPPKKHLKIPSSKFACTIDSEANIGISCSIPKNVQTHLRWTPRSAAGSPWRKELSYLNMPLLDSSQMSYKLKAKEGF